MIITVRNGLIDQALLICMECGVLMFEIRLFVRNGYIDERYEENESELLNFSIYSSPA